MKKLNVVLIGMALLATTKAAFAGTVAVPDTASTSYLLGAGFVGLACLKSWLGSKR